MRVIPGGQIIFAEYLLFHDTQTVIFDLSRNGSVWWGNVNINVDTEHLWKIRTIAIVGFYPSALTDDAKYMLNVYIYSWLGNQPKEVSRYGSWGIVTAGSPFVSISVDANIWIAQFSQVFIEVAFSNANLQGVSGRVYIDGYRR